MGTWVKTINKLIPYSVVFESDPLQKMLPLLIYTNLVNSAWCPLVYYKTLYNDYAQ